jgi:tRNA/tmRNA/rRNA uracil-C5-methylase (TrmA/RlmC/RlmD family)
VDNVTASMANSKTSFLSMADISIDEKSGMRLDRSQRNGVQCVGLSIQSTTYANNLQLVHSIANRNWG